jgi:hypothetical protein
MRKGVPIFDGPQKPKTSTSLAWEELAACKGTDTEDWVPDAAEVVTDWHRDHCEVCPVRKQCLTWATDGGEWGVWAATTREERRVLRRRQSRREQMARARAEQREGAA